MTTHSKRDLRYSKDDSEKYRKLINDAISPFHGTTFKDLFLYAATYGFAQGLRQPLVRPQSNIPLSALNDEEKWLLKAMALADTNSLHVLNNDKEMYLISEEYANGALDTIYLEVFGGKAGKPYKRMMQEVFDEFEFIQK